MAFLNANTSTTVWRQGSPVVTQTANRALYRKFVEYAAGMGVIGTVVRTGTGNGTIDDLAAGVNAVAETWTVTFSNATTFAVSGSVSGAQAGGTVGTNYISNGTVLTAKLAFKIIAGGTAFINGDTFTIPVTAGALSGQPERWVLDRWSPFTTAGGGFNYYNDQTGTGISGALIWHGQGNGSEQIYAGMCVVENAGLQQWNFTMRGYTGFSSSQAWDNNLGQSSAVFTAQWDQNMQYWLRVNARRIVAAWVVSNTMHSLYTGLIKPYASPAEWPYPLLICGEISVITAWNNTGGSFHHGVHSMNNGANAWLRKIDGTWLQSSAGGNLQVWVTGTDGKNPSTWDSHENWPGGDHQIFPKVAYAMNVNSVNQLAGTVFGVLDGCYNVTGFSQSAQTVLAIGGTNYLVVNDVFRSTRIDFWALKEA